MKFLAIKVVVLGVLFFIPIALPVINIGVRGTNRPYFWMLFYFLGELFFVVILGIFLSLEVV